MANPTSGVMGNSSLVFSFFFFFPFLELFLGLPFVSSSSEMAIFDYGSDLGGFCVIEESHASELTRFP